MTIEAVSIPSGASVPDGRTNAYLVGETDAVLVDPAGRTDQLDEAVSGRDVSHVTVTHTHSDHVGAVAEYAAELDATLWGRAGREAEFERAIGRRPDLTMREGTRVGPTTVVETPGHKSDHVAFLAGREAVSGDVAFASGSVAIGSSGDLRAYLTTLRRLRTLDLTRLHPGHGPPIDDPVERIEVLLRHRLDREQRVLAAVQAGATTADEVVDAAYDSDVGDARKLARLTVQAHLRKLDVERALAWDGQRARPR